MWSVAPEKFGCKQLPSSIFMKRCSVSSINGGGRFSHQHERSVPSCSSYHTMRWCQTIEWMFVRTDLELCKPRELFGRVYQLTMQLFGYLVGLGKDLILSPLMHRNYASSSNSPPIQCINKLILSNCTCHHWLLEGGTQSKFKWLSWDRLSSSHWISCLISQDAPGLSEYSSKKGWFTKVWWNLFDNWGCCWQWMLLKY